MADITTFETVERKYVPPDPGVLQAIGLSHRLPTAAADLVDNAVDAGATKVLIRFIRSGANIARLVVADNGDGMSGVDIDGAMRLGRPKENAAGALGHFGMGLKAASFSQACELTVLSRAQGASAEGRRMVRDRSDGFEIDVLAESQVKEALLSQWIGLPGETGTAILWDRIETFPAAKNPAVTTEFISEKIAELRRHLGLTFHRLLERRAFSIDIDVFDTEEGEAGFAFDVEPIDPFGYSRPGDHRFPKRFVAHCRGEQIDLQCHIWPARSDSHQFKLDGQLVDRFQGFYLYRNDRLIHAGGWNGVTKENKKRRLARVAIDIEKHLDLFAMSSEKQNVRLTADAVRAIEDARSEDGLTFDDYLQTAEDVFEVGNRRRSERVRMLPPGQGIAPRIKRAMTREVDLLEGEEPVAIRWERMSGDDFCYVDRPMRTLVLNEQYRRSLLKGGRGGVNDAPLVKALLYLLFEDIFRGAMYGARDKDNVALWTEVLTAAALEELDDYDG